MFGYTARDRVLVETQVLQSFFFTNSVPDRLIVRCQLSLLKFVKSHSITDTRYRKSKLDVLLWESMESVLVVGPDYNI